MKITLEENVRAETVRKVAERMLVAARTAPKARGIDNLSIAMVDKEGIQKLSDKLKEMANRAETMAHLMRDANNILSADGLVLIGTRLKSVGLRSCNMCGFPNCDERDKHPEVPCVFNPGDLGIAIGSAVSVAVDARVDNRIMYSVGQAALEMKLLGEDVKIAFGIPLSVSAKNPFFDRK
ncbi:MAG: DUF2148 domain-containing protein [Bacteroidota bacterium]|jgi:uncharacterized ferredoxin-like protein